MPVKRSALSSAFILRIVALHCVLPLIVGATCYLFRRPTTLLTTYLNFHHAVPHLPPAARLVSNLLPDFCWGYSLAFALYFWSARHKQRFFASAAFIFTLLLGSEFVQMAMPGWFTFDFFDLIALLIAFLFATLQARILLYETGAV